MLTKTTPSISFEYRLSGFKGGWCADIRVTEVEVVGGLMVTPGVLLADLGGGGWGDTPLQAIMRALWWVGKLSSAIAADARKIGTMLEEE